MRAGTTRWRSSMQRTVARRSISRGSFGDLDESLLGDETLVAYAAAAGTVADDGTGRNSPYTAALLEYLEEPLEIQTLFRQVRARVLAATERQQRPHEYASLVRNHYLREVTSPPPAVVRPRGGGRGTGRGGVLGVDPGEYEPGELRGVQAALPGWRFRGTGGHPDRGAHRRRSATSPPAPGPRPRTGTCRGPDCRTGTCRGSGCGVAVPTKS